MYVFFFGLVMGTLEVFWIMQRTISSFNYHGSWFIIVLNMVTFLSVRCSVNTSPSYYINSLRTGLPYEG